jgi:hypothetical protein
MRYPSSNGSRMVSVVQHDVYDGVIQICLGGDFPSTWGSISHDDGTFLWLISFY